MIELIEEKLMEYVTTYTKPESNVLMELSRETHAKVIMPQMLSGQLQGKLLTMFSNMIQPNRILEIGTYTGYSAICLAQGLTENGTLHTIDINEELKDMASSYIEKAGLKEKIIQHTGNAIDIIPTLNETFDLVFIDADKVNYSNYYDLVFDKTRTGGFIIADNVLWGGKVIDDEKDEDTQAIVDFCKKVRADNRIENVLLPIRDGLMVVMKQ